MSLSRHLAFVIAITAASVASAQNAAQPTLRLSTTAVPVQAAAGSNPPSQTVEIYNIGSGTLNPTVSTTASWLTATLGAQAACNVSPSGQCLPISISFNTASLAAGTYTAFVNVYDPNAVDSPQNVVVTLLLGSVPSSFTVYEPPNGGTSVTTVYTQGLVNTSASTSGGGNWLSVSLEGSFGGVFFPYEISVNSAGVSTPGTYQGSIVFSGSNVASDNKTVNVTLDVTTSPIASLSTPALNLIAGANGTASQTIGVSNLGQGSLSVTGATPTVTTGSGWLTATVASNSAVTVTASAAGLQPGSYQGSVALTSNAENNSQLVIPVNFLVTAQTGPQIAFGGVVDNAIGQGPISPGEIAVAYGSGFTSSSPTGASSTPLSNNLNGVQVLVNGTAAPLYYISGGQIDFQVPYNTPAGTATIQVVDNGTNGNLVSATVQATQPRILVFLGYSGQPPIIVNYKDGSIVTSNTGFTALPAHAASPGDTLIIYAIGLGQTNPAATTGAAAPDGTNGTTLETVSGVTVQLGGGFTPTTVISPSFVGLAPGFVGLYQINVTLPPDVPTGDSVPLMLNMSGASSNAVDIAIQ